MSQKSIYSDAQWEWCAGKHREGYSIQKIADFLGLNRETVARKFYRMGVIPQNRYELPPLSDFADEFNSLFEEGEKELHVNQA